MAVLTVAGVAFPTPTTLSVSINDIANAERNTNATMIAERIGTKRKIELSYVFLTAAQTQSILSTVQASFFFTVTYPDPLTGSNRTMTCYSGDKSVGIVDILAGVIRFKDIKLSFIER